MRFAMCCFCDDGGVPGQSADRHAPGKGIRSRRAGTTTGVGCWIGGGMGHGVVYERRECRQDGVDGGEGDECYG